MELCHVGRKYSYIAILLSAGNARQCSATFGRRCTLELCCCCGETYLRVALLWGGNCLCYCGEVMHFRAVLLWRGNEFLSFTARVLCRVA